MNIYAGMAATADRSNHVFSLEDLAKIRVSPLTPSEYWSRVMRSYDCDPKDGWVLVLPRSVKGKDWVDLDFVKFSPLIDDMIFMNPRNAGLLP